MNVTDRPIDKETISLYARTNEAFLTQPVRGIVLEFPGLGGGSCLGGIQERGDYDTPFSRQCAEQGLLLAYMFSGPWSWMNTAAVRMTDELVDALLEKYALPDDTRIVVSGGSMGGLGALICVVSTRHKVVACASACPCCDVPDRFDCHPDFPRTLYCAVAHLDMPFTEALKTISPMHRINDMPDIPYYIVNCCADEIFPEAQTDLYVETLKARGLDVTYAKLPGQLHGYIPDDDRAKFNEFIISKTLGK